MTKYKCIEKSLKINKIMPVTISWMKIRCKLSFINLYSTVNIIIIIRWQLELWREDQPGCDFMSFGYVYLPKNNNNAYTYNFWKAGGYDSVWKLDDNAWIIDLLYPSGQFILLVQIYKERKIRKFVNSKVNPLTQREISSSLE